MEISSCLLAYDLSPSSQVSSKITEISLELFVDVFDDRLMCSSLVPLQCQDKIRTPSTNCSAIAFCVPIASMVMIAPLMSTSLRSSGMAVISFDFSSQATCPCDRPYLPSAHMLTHECSAAPAPLSRS